MKKNELFFEETYNFQTFGNDTLIIADYKDIRISSFQLLAVNVWLKEDNSLHTNHPLY